MRLIDADALRKRFEVARVDCLGMEPTFTDDEVKDAIDAAPTIERNGRWIKVEDSVWKCSVCGEEDCYAYTLGKVKKQNDLFCPRCGARMDEGD